VITVDENSVNWVAGQYITVLDDHTIFPIFPYISSTSPYVFYKDRDIAYTNQNENIPPVAIAGGPKVGFLSAGVITFDLDASDSYAISSGAAISSFLWECEDGTIDDPTSDITTITFTSSGQRWLKLTVTDSNGTTQSTYRRVYVHDRTGANAPCIDFEIIVNPTGSYDSGGWDMKIRLYEGAEISNIPDGTQVVLWYESFYDSTEQYIGASDNVRFAGYITSENISNIFSSGYVEFDASTANSILDSSSMFSISLEESDDVDTWYKFPTGTLTVARCMHHLWKWHSTLLDTCDVFLPVENTNTMKACDDMENGTLWTLTEWAYNNGIFAKACCDKIGRIHFHVDTLMLSTTRQAAVLDVMDILSTDIK
jgi:PKD repeat protein